MNSGQYDRDRSSRTSNAWTAQNRQSNANRYGRDESHSRDRGPSSGRYSRQRGLREGRYFNERGPRDYAFPISRNRYCPSDTDSRYDSRYLQSRSRAAHASERYSKSKGATDQRHFQDDLNEKFRSLNTGNNESNRKQVGEPKEHKANIATRKQSPTNGRGAYVPPHRRARRNQQPKMRDSEPSRSGLRKVATAAPARSVSSYSGSNKSRLVTCATLASHPSATPIFRLSNSTAQVG